MGKLVGENPRLKQKKSKQASKNTDMYVFTLFLHNLNYDFVVSIELFINKI